MVTGFAPISLLSRFVRKWNCPFLPHDVVPVSIADRLVRVGTFLLPTMLQATSEGLSMAKPAHEIRLGLIKARIWRKNTRNGQRHTVSVVRLFRNGDVWKESNRFGRDDLPALRLALDQAHSWIFEQSSTRSKRP